MADSSQISIQVIPDLTLMQRALDAVSRNTKAKISFHDGGMTGSLGRINGLMSEFDKSLAASNARVLAFGASAGAIFAVNKALKETVNATIDVEAQLTSINASLNLTKGGLASFGSQLYKIASDTGKSFAQVADAANELARQGLGVEETLKRTSAALILARRTGLDAADSVNAITAALNSSNNAFLEAADVVNKFVAVDQKFAVSSKDLAEAIKRVGSTASDAGVSLDELIGLVTAAQQTTSRGGAVIGNSFKTIFTRVENSKTQEKLEALGIATKKMSGESLSAIRILQNLATTYDTLTEAQQSEAAQLVGGVYQVNILRASLKDLSKEYSVVGQATKIASGATDEAIRANAMLNTTLQAEIQRTMNGLSELAAQIGSQTFAPVFKDILKGFNDISSAMNGLGGGDAGADRISSGLKAVFAGPGIITAVATIVRLFGTFGSYAIEAFKVISGIGKLEHDRLAIEQQITNQLSTQPELVKQLLSGQKTVNSLAVDYLNTLRGQALLAKEISRLAGPTASLVQLAGARVTSDAGGSSKITVPTRAGGHIPDTVERMGAIEGGYNPGGVRKMNVPGIGQVVYNSAETVRYFGGKQPAIMPPEQSTAGRNYRNDFSSRHGFDPYAAQGMVPNFLPINLLRAFRQTNKTLKAGKFEWADIGSEIGRYSGGKISISDRLRMARAGGLTTDTLLHEGVHMAVNKAGFEGGISGVRLGKAFNDTDTARRVRNPGNGYSQSDFLEEAIADGHLFDNHGPALAKMMGMGEDKRQGLAKLYQKLKMSAAFGATKGMYRASGLVPAFAREVQSVNPSLIKVGQDSRLISANNPEGQGVYNLRDEPGGLGQGISRAISEGRDPKTYNIPNFANPLERLKRGLFEAPRGTGSRDQIKNFQASFLIPLLGGAIDTEGGPFSAATSAAGSFYSLRSFLPGKYGTAAAGIGAAALSGGGLIKSFANSGNKSNIESEAEKLKENFNKISDSLQKYTTTLEELNNAAISGKTSALDLAKLQTKLYNSVKDLPADYQRQALAATNVSEAQEVLAKYTQQTEKRSRQLENAAKLSETLSSRSFRRGFISDTFEKPETTKSKFELLASQIGGSLDLDKIIQSGGAAQAFKGGVSGLKRFGLSEEFAGQLSKVNKGELGQIMAIALARALKEEGFIKRAPAIEEQRRPILDRLNSLREGNRAAERNLYDTYGRIGGVGAYQSSFTNTQRQSKSDLSLELLKGYSGLNEPFLSGMGKISSAYGQGLAGNYNAYQRDYFKQEADFKEGLSGVAGKTFAPSASGFVSEKSRNTQIELSKLMGRTGIPISQLGNSAIDILTKGGKNDAANDVRELLRKNSDEMLKSRQELEKNNQLTAAQKDIAVKQLEISRASKFGGGAQTFLDRDAQQDFISGIQEASGKYRSRGMKGQGAVGLLQNFLALGGSEENSEYLKLRGQAIDEATKDRTKLRDRSAGIYSRLGLGSLSGEISRVDTRRAAEVQIGELLGTQTGMSGLQGLIGQQYNGLNALTGGQAGDIEVKFKNALDGSMLAKSIQDFLVAQTASIAANSAYKSYEIEAKKRIGDIVGNNAFGGIPTSSALMEKMMASAGGYTAGAMRKMGGGGVIYNSAESVVPFMGGQVVNPPMGSLAGALHKKNFMAAYGMNPYKLLAVGGPSMGNLDPEIARLYAEKMERRRRFINGLPSGGRADLSTVAGMNKVSTPIPVSMGNIEPPRVRYGSNQYSFNPELVPARSGGMPLLRSSVTLPIQTPAGIVAELPIQGGIFNSQYVKPGSNPVIAPVSEYQRRINALSGLKNIPKPAPLIGGINFSGGSTPSGAYAGGISDLSGYGKTIYGPLPQATQPGRTYSPSFTSDIKTIPRNVINFAKDLVARFPKISGFGAGALNSLNIAGTAFSAVNIGFGAEKSRRAFLKGDIYGGVKQAVDSGTSALGVASGLGAMTGALSTGAALSPLAIVGSGISINNTLNDSLAGLEEESYSQNNLNRAESLRLAKSRTDNSAKGRIGYMAAILSRAGKYQEARNLISQFNQKRLNQDQIPINNNRSLNSAISVGQSEYADKYSRMSPLDKVRSNAANLKRAEYLNKDGTNSYLTEEAGVYRANLGQSVNEYNSQSIISAFEKKGYKLDEKQKAGIRQNIEMSAADQAAGRSSKYTSAAQYSQTLQKAPQVGPPQGAAAAGPIPGTNLNPNATQRPGSESKLNVNLTMGGNVGVTGGDEEQQLKINQIVQQIAAQLRAEIDALSGAVTRGEPPGAAVAAARGVPTKTA